MAREFINGSSEFLRRNSAILTNEPMTMACWFNPDTTNTHYVLMCIGSSSSGKDWDLRVEGTTSKVRAAKLNGSSIWAQATATYSSGSWQHAAGTFGANNARAAFYNGANKGTNSTNVSDPTVARTSIGARYRNTTDRHMDGEIAEACIYNVVLTDDEIALLAQGISPLHVRPQSLVAYWPLIGRHSPEIDIVGGFDMTLNGTPTADPHVNIVTRPPLYIPGAPAAGGGGGGADARSFGLIM